MYKNNPVKSLLSDNFDAQKLQDLHSMLNQWREQKAKLIIKKNAAESDREWVKGVGTQIKALRRNIARALTAINKFSRCNATKCNG